MHFPILFFAVLLILWFSRHGLPGSETDDRIAELEARVKALEGLDKPLEKTSEGDCKDR